MKLVQRPHSNSSTELFKKIVAMKLSTTMTTFLGQSRFVVPLDVLDFLL